VLTILACCIAIAAADSVPPVVVTWDDVARRVFAQHPVARAARLSRDQAENDIRIAQGAFDPTLSATWDRKAKKGTESYNDLVAELKVPTVTGADIKLGYSRGVGPYVNPTDVTANPGQLSLGLSLPLGQRLLTDERRTALVQARAALELAEGDRIGVLNALMLRAARDYGRWYDTWRRAAIARDGVQLAAFRFRAVSSRFRNGEAPAIDTLEARLEVRRRDGQRVEADQALLAATYTLQAYLWDERGRAEDLPAGAVPSVLGIERLVPDSTRIRAWLAAAAQAHPEMVKATARLRQAEAQRALVMQQFIPAASIDLSAIADADKSDGLFEPGGYAANYKYGASLKSPLLFMRERGRASQAAQRLEQLRAAQAQVKRDIANAVRVTANDLRALDELLVLQRDIVVQARALLAGEQRRFDGGESSLLIVNLRERLVLDEESRLASLEARSVAIRAEAAVATGVSGPLP
jgi:outer membrane protein TolC